jgi:acyl-CoA dehydrogenase
MLADLVTRDVIERAESGVWPDALWCALESHGLTRPLAAEEHGGIGASWSEAAVILRAAARSTAPVPIAETMLASWLLSAAGIEVPAGPLSVAPADTTTALQLERVPGGVRVHGDAPRVPWGAQAGHLVAVAPLEGRRYAALVRRQEVTIAPGRNLAREPRDAVAFGGAPAVAAAPLPESLPEAPLLPGALVRAVQISGALERVLEESLRHAQGRVQFGRPIASFQVIQHQLAVLASQVGAAGAAVDRACDAISGPDPEPAVASARIRAGATAGKAAAIAHAVHGAIGFTYEHALHFATRRLWAWRAEFGSESWWAGRLGRRVLERGADAMWPDLADGA